MQKSEQFLKFFEKSWGKNINFFKLEFFKIAG